MLGPEETAPLLDTGGEALARFVARIGKEGRIACCTQVICFIPVIGNLLPQVVPAEQGHVTSGVKEATKRSVGVKQRGGLEIGGVWTDGDSVYPGSTRTATGHARDPTECVPSVPVRPR